MSKSLKQLTELEKAQNEIDALRQILDDFIRINRLTEEKLRKNLTDAEERKIKLIEKQ